MRQCFGTDLPNWIFFKSLIELSFCTADAQASVTSRTTKQLVALPDICMVLQ